MCQNIKFYHKLVILWIFTLILTPTSIRANAIETSVAKKSIQAECEGPNDDFHCLCYVNNSTGKRCALTFALISRLGNNMGEYASLYSFSKLNNRPAFVNHEMSQLLRQYFKITLPVLNKTTENVINWENVYIHDYMEEKYAHFEGQFIRIIGTPYSWKFYHQVADEIKREFTFHENITKIAQFKLEEIRQIRNSVTFIGVHVRRGDYVEALRGDFQGVVADEGYLIKATDTFRERYPDSVFVVVSDDMEWCRNHISNALGDVYFLGNNNQSSPIEDLSLLANCNHTIMTIGSYGYWASFLAGGDVIYLANYTLPHSPLNPHLRFETVFWKHWKPIPANLSLFGHQ